MSLTTQGIIRLEVIASPTLSTNIILTPASEYAIKKDDKFYAVCFDSAGVPQIFLASPVTLDLPGYLSGPNVLPALAQAAASGACIEVSIDKTASSWTVSKISIPAPKKK